MIEKNKNKIPDCCVDARAVQQPPHAPLEVFNLILLIVLNAWVDDYFVKKQKKQLFLVHVLYSLFFMNLKIDEVYVNLKNPSKVRVFPSVRAACWKSRHTQEVDD